MSYRRDKRIERTDDDEDAENIKQFMNASPMKTRSNKKLIYNNKSNNIIKEELLNEKSFDDEHKKKNIKKNYIFLKSIIFLFVILFLIPIIISIIGDGWTSIYLSKSYKFNDIPDLTGKIAIVTGANSGIGKVSAKELVRKGAFVIATARSKIKGDDLVNDINEELKNEKGIGKIKYMELDMASMKQIKSFTKEFINLNIKLDILILNSGIMMPPFELSVDGYESQIATNHLGSFLLVKLFDSIIKASKTRIVVVSSLAHEGSYKEGIKLSTFTNETEYNPIFSYGQSKLANILFSNELAKRLNNTGATSNCLHPGMIQSNLTRHLQNQNSYILNLLAIPVLEFVKLASLTTNDGALTQLYVATSPKLTNITGKYFKPISKLGNPSSQSQDEILQTMLWKESEKLISKYL
jgi:NAD(P)-dependent dehydrogenase (short-subunit alcohol dehydrogenase family)